MTHEHSRKIWIRRAGSFMTNAQAAAADFMSQSKQSIGSYFESATSLKSGTGLTHEEQKALLPSLIDAYGPEDRMWHANIKTYYDNLLTMVPVEGKELEIGLEKGNHIPVVSFDEKGNKQVNMPINVSDYIRYRHALGSPVVGSSEETTTGNQLKMFYIFDPVAKQIQNDEKYKTSDEALTLYLTLKNDKPKVDMFLTLLGIDPRDYPNAEERGKQLKLKAEKDPKKFLEVNKLSNFEERYMVQNLLNIGILKQIVGGSIFDNETNKLVASSFDETVKLIMTPEYSDTLVTWKAKAQDVVKKTSGNRRKPAQQSA